LKTILVQILRGFRNRLNCLAMGITNCKKHGRQGFDEVCGHIDAEYKQDIYRERRDFCIGDLLGILICEECWKKVDLDKFQPYLEMSFDEFLDLDDEEVNKIEDEWHKVYESVKAKTWCLQCIAEVKVNQSKRNGEPLPFPIYEKTLTQLQLELIKELEKNLTDNFEFQKSVVEHQNRLAIFFNSGGFTRPLTIEIYYVIDETKQSEIVEFIDKFLSQTELNQAKIVFLEAENWIITEHPTGSTSYHKDEEKILKEVLLNC
jgi:hypothetical protein